MSDSRKGMEGQEVRFQVGTSFAPTGGASSKRLPHPEPNSGATFPSFFCGHLLKRDDQLPLYLSDDPVPNKFSHDCQRCEKIRLSAKRATMTKKVLVETAVLLLSEDKLRAALNSTRDDTDLRKFEQESERLSSKQRKFLDKYRKNQDELTRTFREIWGESSLEGVGWPILEDANILQTAFVRILSREQRGVSPKGSNRKRVEKGLNPKVGGDTDAGDVELSKLRIEGIARRVEEWMSENS